MVVKNMLPIKDIFFGKIDAKHELLSGNKEDVEQFLESFLVPKMIKLNDYYEGKKFILTGLKGTGKTALLRYISKQVEEQYKAESSFVLFKSEFDELDRQNFNKHNISYVDNESNYNTINNKKTVWIWLMHRTIIEMVEKSYYEIFKNDANWQKYKALINSLLEENKPSGFIKRLFPTVKKGILELDSNFKVLAAKLGIDLEWENPSENKIKFEEIIKQANFYFNKLTPSDGRIYILLDELELSIMNTKQYKRDLELIKELILALNQLNFICRTNNFNVYFVASVRLEVMTAIETTGDELNKIVEDFGDEIYWHYGQADSYENPLIQIIIKRLRTNEKKSFIYVEQTDKEIFDKYFDFNINKVDSKKFILERTWYRPRDIVRLLTLAQENVNKDIRFNRRVFHSTSKSYSTKSWVEATEELRARYTSEEIEGIKQIFQGIESPMSIREINARIDELKQLYPEINFLLEKKVLGTVLKDCFKLGIIGNGPQRVRFAFRGDDSLDLMQPIQIHRALWDYLSVTQNELYTNQNKKPAMKLKRK